jgi:hypothetical protein
MCLGDLVETFEVVQQNSSAIVTTMTEAIYATVNSDALSKSGLSAIVTTMTEAIYATVNSDALSKSGLTVHL